MYNYISSQNRCKSGGKCDPMFPYLTWSDFWLWMRWVWEMTRKPLMNIYQDAISWTCSSLLLRRLKRWLGLWRLYHQMPSTLLISIMSDVVRRKVVREVRSSDGGCYTIKCDGTRDKNNVEELSIGVRFEKDGEPRERLLQMTTPGELDTQSIATKILSILETMLIPSPVNVMAVLLRWRKLSLNIKRRFPSCTEFFHVLKHGVLQQECVTGNTRSWPNGLLCTEHIKRLS